MSDMIEQLIPGRDDLRAIFYDEAPDARPQEGERVIALALVRSGARRNVVAVVLSPEGEPQLATEDSDYLGTAWQDDKESITAMLAAEFAKRNPQLARKQK